MRFGEKIARNENSMILFDPFSHKYMDTRGIPRYDLYDEQQLDRYLRGELLEIEREDGPVVVRYDHVDIALEDVSSSILSNHFPHDWRRK